MGCARRSPCFQCRCRKVKSPQKTPPETRLTFLQVRCDRRPDTCGNCERLDFTCSFQKTVASPTAARANPEEAADRPKRRRGTQACTECRRQKARCSGEVPVCASCHRHQHLCRYPTPKQSGLPRGRGQDERSSDEVAGHDYEGQPSYDNPSLTPAIPFLIHTG